MILTDEELLKDIGVESLIHRHVISRNVDKLFQEDDEEDSPGPLSWSAQQVSDFVSNLAAVYGQYCQSIIDNGVNGLAMAVVLQEEDYMIKLGIESAVHRKVISVKIRRLLQYD